MLYTMIVEQDAMGDYVGSFPDLPGCAPEGETLDELMESVQTSVEQWVAENGLSALPPAIDREPDFSDPRRMPMLVEIDETFLRG